MGSRRQARELSLKILYQLETSGYPLEAVLEDFWGNNIYPAAIRDFAEDLVKGVINHSRDIDEKLSALADNWELNRMAVIDKNILRLAAYEIKYRDDIPAAVSINEALEIAKKYSGLESSRFINGILDKVAKEKKI